MPLHEAALRLLILRAVSAATAHLDPVADRQPEGEPSRYGLALVAVDLVVKGEGLDEARPVGDAEGERDQVLGQPRSHLEADRAAAGVAADERRRDPDPVGRLLHA